MIVTTDQYGSFRYDGELIDPHSEILAGTVAYYLDTNTARQIEKFITGRDKAYRVSAKTNPSFTFVSDKGNFRVMSAEVWTDAKTEELAKSDLLHFSEAIKNEGWDWADTAGSLAGRICRKYAPTTQLQPRWRELSHNSIHQGPMVCAMGGAENVIAWDREKAFLRALYEPVPIGVWSAAPPSAIKSVKGMGGIVRATLAVKPEYYAGRIPPLPVRIHGYSVYPVGMVRGVWTLDMFFDAVDYGGYEIVEIHELIICQRQSVHAQAADRITQIEDKRLRKMVYTRYWGRLAAVGGYEGYREPRFDGGKHLLGSRLNWYYMGKSPMGFDCPPDYRPDHAAFISSSNHLVMNQAIRCYGPDEIIATHVDCIWTKNMDVPPYDSFREKHSGKCRFYGTGCYNVGGNLAAQGFRGKLDNESIEKWGETLNSDNPMYRIWDGAGPNKNEFAISNPPIHDTNILAFPPVRNIPDIYDKSWTSKGWALKNET